MKVSEYPKFIFGRLYLTRGVNDKVAENAHFARFVTGSLARHRKGDWGDLEDEDKKANESALKAGERLFSAYIFGDEKIWIITEADRSATTVLFPEEY
ncbi:MAG: hypothetical protein HZA04_02925 [Nitrospinae bacterium]|nr:hypothetical protein [Nitrospinota bacterium]